MRIARLYTNAGQDPLKGIRVRMETGEDWQDYAVPHGWSRAAAEILIAQVFHKEALPALIRKVPEDGVPEWLWRSEIDDQGLDNISAEWRYRYERDFRDVLNRVAGGLTYEAFKSGLFDSEEDARAFFDELRHIFLNRQALPEIALLATAGLNWAYGIVQPTLVPRQRISVFGEGMSGGVAVPLRTPEKNVFRRIRLLASAAALGGAAEKICVTLPVENADSARFIGMKRQADIDAAATVLGRRMLSDTVHHVMDAADRSTRHGLDPARNKHLAEAALQAKAAGVTENFIQLALDYARQGCEEIALAPEDAQEDDGGATLTAALSVPDAFIESALTGHGFMIYDGDKPLRHVSAARLLDQVAENLWQAGEPGIFFRDAVLAASPFLADNADAGQSASGGYVFAAGSAAPSAVIDLCAFSCPQGVLKVEELSHVTALLTLALDAASTDSNWRPVSLSLTNIQAFLMQQALAYDSEAGRAAAGLATAIISGVSHLAAAQAAAKAGAFRHYAGIEKTFLQSVKDRAAFLSGTAYVQRGVAKRQMQIRASLFPELARSAKEIWEKAYIAGKEKGFRNAHLCAIDTPMELQALLAARTQDIAPERSLVRFEGYFSDAHEAEIYGKKLNPGVPRALDRLGYNSSEIDDMHFYAVGHGTLFEAPHINHVTLRRKGFHQAALDALEAALRTAHHIRYVFNKWTLGADFCVHMLGFSPEEIDAGTFDMLEALGFSTDEIEEANLYCCGAMTLEGAPHLKPEHLAVFEIGRAHV